METSDSSNTKRFVCNCNQHCRGQPRFVSQATFYRHLANAEGRERDTLKKIKTAGSLDAARTVLANAASFNDHWQRFREQPDDQPRPSRPVCASARRAETIRAMVKRAREAEPNPRRGKRKCARNKNIDSNASCPSIFNIEVTDLHDSLTNPIEIERQSRPLDRPISPPHSPRQLDPPIPPQLPNQDLSSLSRSQTPPPRDPPQNSPSPPQAPNQDPRIRSTPRARYSLTFQKLWSGKTTPVVTPGLVM